VTAAAAASGADNVSTVDVTPSAIRSLTVSPSSGVFAKCADTAAQAPIATLSIPNGLCFLGTLDQEQFVTITNGDVAGEIDANGEAADPVPAGTGAWTLGQAVGPEVFVERTYYGPTGAGGILLTNSPECDLAFQNGGCEAAPNISSDVGLEVRSPTSSTTTATQFKITTTWTAVS
jgi:hypothetical protein